MSQAPHWVPIPGGGGDEVWHTGQGNVVFKHTFKGNVEDVIRGVRKPKTRRQAVIRDLHKYERHEGPERQLMGRDGRGIRRVVSMASGGMISAPPYKGKIVRLHDGEMVVPARKVASVVKAMKKSGIALPIGALRRR
jgi:hypothetical protein